MKGYLHIINGPNLNLLGRRQPEVYGSETLDDVIDSVCKAYPAAKISHFQSNSECDIICELQYHGFNDNCRGIVLNAGAYTHYSYAIADAIAAVKVPVIEVHMSNVYAREDFRHKSVIAPYCKGSIAGFGSYSYMLAIEYLLNYGKEALKR